MKKTKFTKLVKLDELIAFKELINFEDKKVGFTCGTFDLTHTGHFMMFSECSNKCDKLVVGLQSDPSIDRKNKNTPIQTVHERLELLQGCSYIDKVIIYDTEEDLENILKQLLPDIRFLGADWEGERFTGYELPIKVRFNSRNHSFSTTNLRDRVYEAECIKRGKK